MVNNLEDCIELINRQNEIEDLTDRDIDDLLEQIEKFIKMKYGKTVFFQIEKLCNARNFDRAINLLKTRPKNKFTDFIPKGIIESSIVIMMLGVGILVAVVNSDSATEDEIGIRWEETEGTITQSRLGSRASNSSEYYPAIEYAYQIEGTRYYSDSVIYENVSDPITIVENYFEGDIVDIYYNAENPKQSYFNVQTQVAGNNWVMYIIILIGIASVFYFIERIRKKKKLLKDFL